MAVNKIYTCDRCGREFEKTNKIVKYGVSILGGHKGGLFDERIDLCDNCLDDLDDFMKMVGNENTHKELDNIFKKIFRRL